MSLQIEEKDGVSILSFSQDNINQTKISYDLRDEIRNLFKQQKYQVVIDMYYLEMVTSSVLSVLIAAWEKALKQGGHIFLCSASDAVKELIQVTQLGEFLKVFPTREEAIQAFQKPQ